MNIKSAELREFELRRGMLISALADIDYVSEQDAEPDEASYSVEFLYNMELCRYALEQVIKTMPPSVKLGDFSLNDLFATEEIEEILRRYGEECDELGYDLAYEIAFNVFTILNKQIDIDEQSEAEDREEVTAEFRSLWQMIDES